MIIIPGIGLILESPKFLLTKHEDEKAFQVIEKLLGEERKHELDEQARETIKLQYRMFMDSDSHHHSSDHKRNNYADMLNKTYMWKSIMLFVLWYIVSFVYYGLIYILPSIYQELTMSEKKTSNVTSSLYDEIISDIIFSCIFEFPSDIANGILPNTELFKRKGCLIFGFIFTSIFCILSCFSYNMIPVYSSLAKSFINVSYNVFFIYTSESYPTYMRSTALGMCNFFTRLGGFTTPFINETLMKISYFMPFVAFSVISVIGFVICLFLDETYGKKLF